MAFVTRMLILFEGKGREGFFHTWFLCKPNRIYQISIAIKFAGVPCKPSKKYHKLNLI